jgi:hypothetical protein
MTLETSRRGKEYLETAQTLLRAAQTMTDHAIAGQLEALADDYQRRAEKASHVQPKHWLARLPLRKASGLHDRVGGFTAHLATEMSGDFCCRSPTHSRVILVLLTTFMASELGRDIWIKMQ